MYINTLGFSVCIDRFGQHAQNMLPILIGSIVNMNEGIPTQLFNEHKNLHFDYNKIFITSSINYEEIAVNKV